MKLDSFKLNYNINEFIALIGSTPNGDVLHQQGPLINIEQEYLTHCKQ